jgi:hypothetical protein
MSKTIADFLMITMEWWSAVSNAGDSTMTTTTMKTAEKKRLQTASVSTRQAGLATHVTCCKVLVSDSDAALQTVRDSKAQATDAMAQQAG